MSEQVILGSGNLYIVAFNDAIPADATFETETNMIGYIKGGASLEYKPTEYEVKDDNENICKRFIISEEITFKSGILTWDTSALSKLVASGTYEDDATNKVKTLKLGGVGAREMAQYAIRFVHIKADGNTVKITLVGTASNGFSLAFASDKETVIDAEFKALGHDTDGTQVIFEETYTS